MSPNSATNLYDNRAALVNQLAECEREQTAWQRAHRMTFEAALNDPEFVILVNAKTTVQRQLREFDAQHPEIKQAQAQTAGRMVTGW